MVAVCHLRCLNCGRPGTPPSNGGRSKKHLDCWGPIEPVMVLTSIILLMVLVCWRKEDFYQSKYDHMHKKSEKIRGKFSFNLKLCDRLSKKCGFVCFAYDTQKPTYTYSSLHSQCKWALRRCLLMGNGANIPKELETPSSS